MRKSLPSLPMTVKRAIERLLVPPLSNLMASGQIGHGNRIRVTCREGSPSLVFFREAAERDGWNVAGSIAA